MKNLLKNQYFKIVLLTMVIAIAIISINHLNLSNNPNDTKVVTLSAKLRKACETNTPPSEMGLLHNGKSFGNYAPVDFVTKYGNVEKSIPYENKDRGRMFPVADLFEIKDNTTHVQFLTCTTNREFVFSREDVLARPDPLYWISKRKGFLSVQSMIYDETSDSSKKTGYKIRPILAINLISTTE